MLPIQISKLVQIPKAQIPLLLAPTPHRVLPVLIFPKVQISKVRCVASTNSQITIPKVQISLLLVQTPCVADTNLQSTNSKSTNFIVASTNSPSSVASTNLPQSTNFKKFLVLPVQILKSHIHKVQISLLLVQTPCVADTNLQSTNSKSTNFIVASTNSPSSVASTNLPESTNFIFPLCCQHTSPNHYYNNCC